MDVQDAFIIGFASSRHDYLLHKQYVDDGTWRQAGTRRHHAAQTGLPLRLPEKLD